MIDVEKSIEYAKTVQTPTYVFSLIFALAMPVAPYAFDWAVDTNNNLIKLEQSEEARKLAIAIEMETQAEFRNNRIRQLDSMEQDLKLMRKFIIEQR